jgi:hypothetical protein
LNHRSRIENCRVETWPTCARPCPRKATYGWLENSTHRPVYDRSNDLLQTEIGGAANAAIAGRNAQQRYERNSNRKEAAERRSFHDFIIYVHNLQTNETARWFILGGKKIINPAVYAP